MTKLIIYKKLSKIYLLIITIFITFACNKNNKNPDNNIILNPDTMANIIKDIHITEAYIAYMQTSNSNTQYNTIYAYNNLLKKHNISKQQLDSNLKYYANNPIILKEIYQKVINELNIINH